MFDRWRTAVALLILFGQPVILPAEIVSRRSFRTSDGVNLSFLETRPQTGERKLQIVFVTGWCMPASLWRRQLESLGDRYHALALDPRGQGESDAPASGYTAERRATDIQEFIQPLSNVVLVGWSLGALEVLQSVHMFGAKRIAGMVLVDSSVGEPPVPPSSVPFTNGLRKDRDKALGDFIRAVLPRYSPAEIESLVGGAKRMSLDDSIALLSYPFEREHWKRIAHAFPKPLLYIVTPQFASQARNLKKNRPATRIEIFEHAGHALFVDEPERFNALIRSFADGIAKP